MRRKQLRLVTYVSLVAFLLANRPAGFPAELTPLRTAAETCQDLCRCSGLPDCQCDQCLSKNSAGTQGKVAKSAPKRDQERPRPSCPCPGGCIYCSLTKVPCDPSPAVLPVFVELVFDCIVDGPPVFTSFFYNSLFRPPRV